MEVAQEALLETVQTAVSWGRCSLLLVHVYTMAVLPALLDNHQHYAHMSGEKTEGQRLELT